jgi:hypothetical protein
MKITIALSLKEYRRVVFFLVYRNLSIKILTGIGFAIILLSLVSIGSDNFQYQGLLVGGVMAGLLPLFVHFNANKQYSSNNRLKEEMVYEIEKEKVKIKGSTFSTEWNWDAIFKLEETKKWFLIWQDAQQVNVLPKKAFTQDQLYELRERIVEALGPKAKLRKK